MQEELLPKRRAFLVFAGQGVLFGTLLARLHWLQNSKGEMYQTLSDKNRLHGKLLLPIRGSIYDCTGKLLASNKMSYGLSFVPEQGNTEKILQKLKSILKNFDSDEALQNIKSKPKYVATLLASNLDFATLAKISLHRHELSGVEIEQQYHRIYHFPNMAHVLGYVGPVPKELMRKEKIFTIPGLQVGKAGIEKNQDDILRGEAGIQQIEKDARGRRIREIETQPAVPGNDIKLSINQELQNYTNELLAEHTSGSVVLLSVPDGKVLTLASYPSYDNNIFMQKISHETWKQLSTDPNHPLINKAISGLYAPGSTFKMIVALAALEAGVSCDVRFNCHGVLEVSNNPFHCHSWRYGGHGLMNLEMALARSCDVYFYHLAQIIGVDAIAKTALKFGLGTCTGIELPEEKPGLIPNKSWKQKIFKTGWSIGESINVSIGQGYILVTPLQLATMTGILAVGNEFHLPRLLGGLGPKVDIDFNPKHIAQIRKGMEMVANHPMGTVYHTVARNLHIAGKTGTTQVRRITSKDRQKGNIGKDWEWKHQDHAIFVGYAPLENPKYAIAVVIEHGKSGSRVAAPVASKILEKACC